MTRNLLRGLLGSVVAVVFFEGTCCSVPAQALSPEAAVTIRSFPMQAPISLSADGNWVAFTLQPTFQGTAQTRGLEAFSGSGVTWLAVGAEIWIANTRTREQLRVSDASSSSWSP